MRVSGLLHRWELLLAHNLWGLIIYLFSLLVILSSEIPRIATDWSERVFPGVWKLLSFLRLPSWDRSPSLFCLSFYLFYFVLPPFEDIGLLFLVPDILCQHSEVVLWNLLSAQVFFRWVCGEESGLPILFLCNLRNASPMFSLLDYLCFFVKDQLHLK